MSSKFTWGKGEIKVLSPRGSVVATPRRKPRRRKSAK